MQRLFVLLLFFINLAPAQDVPTIVRFSGTIPGSTGPIGITLSIYADQSSPTPLWLESQSVVLDSTGQFSVLLGSNRAGGLPPTLFSTTDARWLGITPEGQPELPRIRLVSVPYALKAADASTLGGYTAEQIITASARSGVTTIPTSTTNVTPAAGEFSIARADRSSRSPQESSAPSGPRGSFFLNEDSAVVLEGYDDLAHAPLRLLLNPVGGNVGIGTSTPAQKLSVAGTIESTSGGFKFPDGTVQPSAISLTNLNASNLTSGTIPGSRLGGVYSNQLVFSNASNAFAGNGSGLANVNALQLNGLYSSTFARLDQANSFTGNQNISGNLGLGTTPTEKLDVAGNIKVTGTVKFPDGSSLASAQALVPQGFSIMGSSPVAPTGYTQTGWYVANGQPWTSKTPMPTRRNAGAVGVVNGKIYYISGCTDTEATNIVEEYDPATNTWSTKAPIPTARCMPAFATLNGKIYVMGGCSWECSSLPTAVEEFTPSSSGGPGSWATKTPMPYAAQAPVAAAVGNKIYVMGGATVPNSVFTDAVYEYDPVADTYAPMASLPYPRDACTASVVYNKIYVFGGYSQETATRVDEFNPTAGATGTWTQKASMPTGRIMATASAVNNFIFVFGGIGYPITGLNSNVMNAVGIYSPESDTWMAGPSMRKASAGLIADTVSDKIYVLGGYIGGTGPGVTLDTNDAFDPAKAVLYVYTKN